jgi:hypothetical protein
MKKEKKVNDIFIKTTVFLAGFVILTIEITGSRILTPFFGSTIYVWSALILTTLAGLAAGYHFGGKIADKYNSLDILLNLITVSGVFLLLIPLIKNPVLSLSNQFGIVFGPALSTIITFGLPMGLLGIVSPYSAKLVVSDNKTLGTKVGNLYSLSTLGSLAGGLLSGYFFALFFSAKTIFIISGLILIINGTVRRFIK